MSHSRHESGRKKIKITQLVDDDSYKIWSKDVNVVLFQLGACPMDDMTTGKTLLSTYFEEHPDFKDEWQSIADDENDYIEPLENDDFAQKCLEHALTANKGWAPWLKDAYAHIFDSLSDDIQDQVRSRSHGDLVTLFANVKLAVRHFEVFDSADLKFKFFHLTMEEHGKNNIMKFFTEVEDVMKRLVDADAPITDKEAQKCLSRGVHQKIFESIIDKADNGDYKSYRALKKALLEKSAKPKVMQDLADIDPTSQQHALITRAQKYTRHSRGQINQATARANHAANKQRLQQLRDEHRELIMTLGQVPPLRRDWGVDNTRNRKRPRDGGSDRDCWEFANRGKCTRRDCKYEHVRASGADAERKRRRTPRSPTRAPSRAPARAPTGMFCKYHRSVGQHAGLQEHSGRPNLATRLRIRPEEPKRGDQRYERKQRLRIRLLSPRQHHNKGGTGSPRTSRSW